MPRFKVLIQPNSKKNEIIGLYGDSLKIKINAPPIDGEANATLVRFLSEVLKISQKNIVVLRGEASKTKLIEISTDLSAAQILEVLISSEK